MRFIYKILEKFLTLSNYKKNVSSEDDNLIGKISFSISKNRDTIDICCDIPESSDMIETDIPFLAEKFASLLASISLGELNEPIHKYITTLSNDTKLPTQHILFFNNVISFWGLLHKDKFYKKVKVEQHQYPIIRPSKVFKP